MRQVSAVMPGDIAYWYLRLNGYLQLDNFIIHPRGRGSALTDADVIGVRFPFRAELGLDDLSRAMRDDLAMLRASEHRIDLILGEVKTNQPCALNGPWTDPERRNVSRLLMAIGCVPHAEIEAAAESVYRLGKYQTGPIEVRMIAVGRDRNPDLQNRYPAVAQITWEDAIGFIWERFNNYAKEKSDLNQWIGGVGKWLKDESVLERREFIDLICKRIGVDCIMNRS